MHLSIVLFIVWVHTLYYLMIISCVFLVTLHVVLPLVGLFFSQCCDEPVSGDCSISCQLVTSKTVLCWSVILMFRLMVDFINGYKYSLLLTAVNTVLVYNQLIL